MSLHNGHFSLDVHVRDIRAPTLVLSPLISLPDANGGSFACCWCLKVPFASSHGPVRQPHAAASLMCNVSPQRNWSRLSHPGLPPAVNNASVSPACEGTRSSVAIVADMSTHHFIQVIVLETAKMKYLDNRNPILELTCGVFFLSHSN